MAAPSEETPLLSQNAETSADSRVAVARWRQCPLQERAYAVLPSCTEETKIYIIISISTCFVAASDPPFKASLTALYKHFLCCQQDEARCHDGLLCYGENGVDGVDGELSTLYQWQSIVNAVGGIIFLCLWHEIIWPFLDKTSSTGKRKMSCRLVMSQTGVFILEIVNAFVAYLASNDAISLRCFKNSVKFAPIISFFLGGGTQLYWASREVIVSHVVSHRKAEPGLYHLEDRQAGFVFLQVAPMISACMSGLISNFIISHDPQSNRLQLWCLCGGLASYFVGILLLLTLPKIDLPSPDSSTVSSSPTTKRWSSLTWLTSDRVIIALVLFSGMASRPLASSVSSNFAVLYISRRLHFNTSNAVVMTTLANIFPPLGPVLFPPMVRYLKLTLYRPTVSSERPASSCTGSSTSLIATPTSSSSISSNSSTESSPAQRPASEIDIQQQNHAQTHGQNHTQSGTGPGDNTPADPRPGSAVTISEEEIKSALIFLVIATIGAGLMAFSNLLQPMGTQPDSVALVQAAIILICIGGSYALFIDAILGGWSAEGKKPVVFVLQQIVNSFFMSVGALVLNHGFQRELEGHGRNGDGRQVGWTYLGIMLVCLLAGTFLVSAAVVSRKRG